MWPVKRRVFISYHHASDQAYYDSLSRLFELQYEVIQDGSLDRMLDSDDCEYVMRRIRERYITGSSCTLVLCGPETPWRKYVDWEIKATLDKEHGLIGVALPTIRQNVQGQRLVADRLHDNIQSGYAQWVEWFQLQQGPTYLQGIIEQANARPKWAIQNNRPLRQRNG